MNQSNHLDHLAATEESMKLDHVQRITKLEATVKEHGEILKEVVPCVASIDKNLRAIKWACIGAVMLYAIQRLGLAEFLKMLIHCA